MKALESRAHELAAQSGRRLVSNANASGSSPPRTGGGCRRSGDRWRLKEGEEGISSGPRGLGEEVRRFERSARPSTRSIRELEEENHHACAAGSGPRGRAPEAPSTRREALDA